MPIMQQEQNSNQSKQLSSKLGGWYAKWIYDMQLCHKWIYVLNGLMS